MIGRMRTVAAVLLPTGMLAIVLLSTASMAATQRDFAECQQPGDLDRGIAACTRVLGDRSIGISGAAAVLANRAIFFTAKGDLDSALGDYNEALRLNPNNSITHNGRGSVWRAKGDLDRAFNDFSEAIRLNPNNGKAYGNRGQIYRLRGELDRALADQDQQLRLVPNDPFAWLVRGETYRYLGDFQRSLADLDRAQALSFASSGAYTARGLTFEKMGDLPHAHAEFEKALAAPNPFHTALDREAVDTAQARLAALDSGAPQPVIPAAPAHPTSPTSIPTPAAVVPAALPTGPAVAINQGRRVALVIGNSAYVNVPALPNPQKDAAAMAAALRAIGFQVVTLAVDETRDKMLDALRNFADAAETADWAMVYYAGHGMEVGGVNYLIPTDARIAVDRDIQFEAIPLTQVLSAATAKKIRLIVLDACRDNPFAPRKTAAPEAVAAPTPTAGAPIGTRSASGKGLAEVKVQGATLVVYAAKDGQVALDGEGGNSPFTVAMVQRIATPGVEINKVFRLVRDDVMEATAGRQEPFTYGSLPGKEDFFFVAK